MDHYEASGYHSIKALLSDLKDVNNHRLKILNFTKLNPSNCYRNASPSAVTHTDPVHFCVL